jgi:hypothetical protein
MLSKVPEHAVWPLPRSAPFAVQRRNRIDQRQGLLRVVPIRAGQTHRERHASPVANQMALAPALRPIGGIPTSMGTTMHRADGTAVHDRSRPINLILSSEPIQQHEVNEIPLARSLPIAQPAPTRHPRTALEFLREHLPRAAAEENKMPVRHARSEMRGRPPFGRRGVVGKNGSTGSHNGSGSSAAAIPVHVTSPARISFRRFCYVL